MKHYGLDFQSEFADACAYPNLEVRMRKLEVADGQIMQIAVQQEIQRSDESRYDHRLHGVLLVSHGMSCTRVAGYLGQSPVTVQRWIQRFNEKGFAGLTEGERCGRPRRISDVQWEELERALRISPRTQGYAQNLWDGKLLAHHLRVRHGVEMGVRQCQRLFRAMGFRRRKPRPLIAKADPEAQRRYKKTAQVDQ
jgi:transposase